MQEIFKAIESQGIYYNAVIMEYKIFDKEDCEKTLEDTAANALKQIEDKKYDTDLIARGISKDNILKYGFAFEDEKCLIMKGLSPNFTNEKLICMNNLPLVKI